MVKYGNSWASFNEQLDYLAERGMIITDKAVAVSWLSRVGYFRLSGYWYALRDHRAHQLSLEGKATATGTPVDIDVFRPGATFQDAVDLYVFDKQLRLLALDALERIEIALRVDIGHYLGGLHPFAHTKPDLLRREFSGSINPRTGASRHQDWMLRHEQLVSRSREDFILACKARYGSQLLLWIAAEAWDFGTMSTLYDGMRACDQDAISSKYGISNGRIFASWLRSLNYLRNVCAHHSRLWNRNIVDQPKLPKAAEVPWVTHFLGKGHALARCYLLLCVTRHLIQVIYPRSSWSQRMKQQLQAFPQSQSIGSREARMGLHEGWEASW